MRVYDEMAGARPLTPHGPAGGGNGRSLDAGETTPYLPVIVDGGVGVRSPETPHARPAPGHWIADPNLPGSLSPIHLSPRSLPENIPPALRRARSETPILDPTVRGCMIAASKGQEDIQQQKNIRRSVLSKKFSSKRLVRHHQLPIPACMTEVWTEQGITFSLGSHQVTCFCQAPRFFAHLILSNKTAQKLPKES